MKTNFSKILLLTILFLSKNSLSNTNNSITECNIEATLNENYFTFVHKQNLSDFKDGDIKTFLKKKYLPDNKTNSSYIFEITNNDIFNQALPAFRGNFSSCRTNTSIECTPQDKDICEHNFKNYKTHNLGFIKDFVTPHTPLRWNIALQCKHNCFKGRVTFISHRFNVT